MPTKLVVQDLVKRYPGGGHGERLILDNVAFRVDEGDFVSLIGPSGCGKSTTLNIVAGLLPATSGTVELDGKPVRTGERGSTVVGYVFQQPRLLNWLTIRQNLEFALRACDVPRAAWASRVEQSLRLVGLEEYVNAYPLRLSGGQQQRVSIARALAVEPEVVLMDEPFSHLDEITAARLRRELTEIWDRTKKTVVFVTHDISEAVLLSEKIVIFGRFGQVMAELPVDLERPRAPDDAGVVELERRVRGLTAQWWLDGEAAGSPPPAGAGR